MLSMVATRRRADRRSGAFEFVDPGDEAEDLGSDLEDVGFQHEPHFKPKTHPFTPIFELPPLRRPFTPIQAKLPWRQCNCIEMTMRMHYHSVVNPDLQETAMAATLEVESTLTDRYQTTVPETVRRALKLGKRDKIHYTIRPSGEVVLTRVEASDGDDPVLGQFLGFLAADITRHPERLQAVDAGLVQRLQSLVGGVDVDLDAALSADDE
jgi:antitoxin PrlF